MPKQSRKAAARRQALEEQQRVEQIATQAAQLAEALRREVLHDNVPRSLRSQLKPWKKTDLRPSFYEGTRTKLWEAMKTAGLVSKGPAGERAFCLECLTFLPERLHEVDHVVPFNKLLENLDLFLRDLNKDAELAEAFLRQESMKGLFVLDDKEVCATKRLISYIFNRLDNLMLLCCADNRQKSDKNVEQYFKQHKLYGAPFMGALESVGGLQKGIIFPAIYRINSESLELGLKRDKVSLCMPSENAQGLGAFVKAWIPEKYGDVLKTQIELDETLIQLQAFQTRQIMEQLNAAKIPAEHRAVKAKQTQQKETVKAHQALAVQREKMVSAQEKPSEPTPRASDEEMTAYLKTLGA